MNDEMIEKAARSGYEAMRLSLHGIVKQTTLDAWENQSELLKNDWRQTAKAMLAVFEEAGG